MVEVCDKTKIVKMEVVEQLPKNYYMYNLLRAFMDTIEYHQTGAIN